LWSAVGGGKQKVVAKVVTNQIKRPGKMNGHRDGNGEAHRVINSFGQQGDAAKQLGGKILTQEK